MNTMCYADDLLVICDDKNILNEVSKLVDNWAKENKLKINYKKDKTARLKVKHKRRKRYLDPQTDLNIPKQEKYRYLGVEID